jgi:hypothetical protein
MDLIMGRVDEEGIDHRDNVMILTASFGLGDE